MSWRSLGQAFFLIMSHAPGSLLLFAGGSKWRDPLYQASPLPSVWWWITGALLLGTLIGVSAYLIFRRQLKHRTRALETEIAERLRVEAALSASESRYRLLAETAQDIILLHDPDNRLLYVNPAGLRFVGLSLEQIMGRSFFEFLCPEYFPLVEDRNAQRASDVRDKFRYELEFFDKDGNRIPLEINSVPVVQDNVITAVLVVARDITERRRSEAAIRERNRDLTVLNNIISAAARSSDPVEILGILCATLAKAFDLPQAAATLLNPEQEIAVVVAEYLTPGRPSALGTAIPLKQQVAEQMLATKQPLYISDAQTDSRISLSQEEAKRRGVVSLFLVPIIVHGQLLSTLGLDALEHRDYTEADFDLIRNAAAAAGQAIEAANLKQELLKHAQELELVVGQRTEALRHALHQAQAADRAKSQFISNVSHELRTPLTSIRVFLELLHVGHSEQHLHYLESLSRETLRLQTLIENILTISRLDLGKVRINPQPVNLNVLLGTLVIDRQRLFEERDLELLMETAVLPEIQADASLIEQVATNLLTNAMNYTPSGGKVSLITALCELDGESWVTFSVGDTGPGIPLEEQGHLFERFYRGDAARTSAAAGTGLGLSICREIIDLHGGRITLVSAPGSGAAFTVWLPVTQNWHGWDEGSSGSGSVATSDDSLRLITD